MTWKGHLDSIWSTSREDTWKRWIQLYNYKLNWFCLYAYVMYQSVIFKYYLFLIFIYYYYCYYFFFWWVSMSERMYQLWSTSTEESLFLGWKRWWPTYNRTKRQGAEGFQWHPPKIWFNAAVCTLVGPVSTVSSSKSGLAQKQGDLVPCCAMFICPVSRAKVNANLLT